LSFTGWRKLKIFLGSRSALLQLCLAAILLRQLCVVWTYGRRLPELGLYLLKNVPVFLESGHEEFHSLWRISWSHRALALCTSVAKMASLLEEW